MKKFILSICTIILGYSVMAQDIDTLNINIEDVSVVSFYRNSSNNVISKADITSLNKGQEPSFILANSPGIFAYSDTGNEYGYSYFRMRGMDQTRINMTLDGMPLAEGEDMGVYFSNYPDIISSMHSIKINNGTSVSNNGISGYAGNISFESTNLLKDTISYAHFGVGSFKTYKSNVQYNSGKIGKFAFHINATNQQSNGFRDYAYNNSQSFFVKAGYFINNNHSFDILSFVGHSRNGQAWIGSTMDEISLNNNVNGCTSAETDRFIQNITKLQYKGIFGNTVLSTSVYYNFLDGYYYFDLDNYMTKLVDPTWQYTGEVDKYNLRHHMYGANVVGKTFINNANITYGVNATRFSRNHVGTYNLGDDILYDNTGYKTDVNTFIAAEYNFRNFNVFGNIQYRHADFDYVGDVEFDKINWDFINWNVGVNYHINNIHEIYANVTQTHREPTRSDMFGGEENFSQLYTTHAESVIDYEAGYKVNTNKFSGRINFYYMDFSNELILNGEYGSNGLPLRINNVNSFRYGTEIILEYHPCNILSLINKSSFSKNNVRDDSETYNHVMSPSVTISQDIKFDITKSLSFNINYMHRGNMYIDLLNNYSLKPSNKFNISATYNINNITISGTVNNIFNNKSFSNGMMGYNGPLYFIDAPRNFFVDVKFNF